MKIYGRHELEKLIIKRDLLRKQYVEQAEEIGFKYNIKKLQAKRQAKKFNIFIDLNFVAILLYCLITYKYFNNIFILIFLGLLIASMGFLIYMYIMKNNIYQKLEEEFTKENESNNQFGKQIVDANYQVAKCAIGVIIYSENFLLLDNLSEIEKNKKFQELFYTYVRAIDKVHGNKATVEDYISYYYNWERKFL